MVDDFAAKYFCQGHFDQRMVWKSGSFDLIYFGQRYFIKGTFGQVIFWPKTFWARDVLPCDDIDKDI